MGLLLRIWDIIWKILGYADVMFVNHVCVDMSVSEGDYEACYAGIESTSVLYVSLQLLVIDSILVLRIWAVMGKRWWILWTFFGLLVCSTTTSIVLSLRFFLNGTANSLYIIPILVFEAIIFSSAFYHGIKESGGLRSLLLRSKSPFRYGAKPILRLVFQGSVLYFATLDSRMGITIMSITISHMLFRLRKQVLPDTVAGVISLEGMGDVTDIRPCPQGS
ncbi:hypothetical protein EDD18DRAFT_1144731 [Armillaria luteobubalina]|uniref:Transmembrane protein n=1 Tax=Armillaria luteobubalina TaxID=153913 RepID=A0AA39V1K7_9AGAR|nr:hypothetical protein EDD18DRAFT_1144731 [Armillaria luteobubalina]